MRDYQVAIIGGGPAGTQCALWLKQLGISVILIEQKSHLGGLTVNNPYPNTWLIGLRGDAAKKLASNIEVHIQEMQIPTLLDTRIEKIAYNDNKWHLNFEHQEIIADCMVLATGVLPNSGGFQASEKVFIGASLDVFTYDYYAKRVAILGGGDNAFEHYALVKAHDPSVCHLYARTIKASQALQKPVDQKDVYTKPYQFQQQDMSIEYENEKRKYDMVLVLYGYQANIPNFLEPFKSQLQLHNGYIQTNPDCLTSLPNVYAIGEVANRFHPCIATAMADGVVAAKAIQGVFKQ